MTKFSDKDRIAATRMVEEGIPKKEVAHRFLTSKSVIHRWWLAYEAGGLKQLASHKKRSCYTATFKLKAIDYLLKNELSYAQVSADLGIPGESLLRRWETQYLEFGPEGIEDTEKGRQPKMPKPKKSLKNVTREQEFKARIQYLEMENAYLKKLNALVSEREKSKKKTKLEQFRN